jgi:hypothetical protein
LGGRTISTCTWSSSITPRTHAAISSASSPGSIRQSTSATASGGITLSFSLPRSIVTAKVARSIADQCRFARIRRRAAESASERSSASRPAASAGGSTVARAAKNCCTSGSTRGGRSAASRRPSARMSRWGAVSGQGIDPWPPGPRAVSRSGSPVFSEITMWPSGAR